MGTKVQGFPDVTGVWPWKKIRDPLFSGRYSLDRSDQEVFGFVCHRRIGRKLEINADTEQFLAFPAAFTP